MTNSELLSPGENIRPQLTLDQAKQLVTKYYGFECESIVELDGYDDKNFKVTVRGNHEQDKNEHYVLKILNSLDSRTVDFIEAQNVLLLYLFNKNIPCSVPQPTITKSYYAVVQLESGKHIVRLMNFFTGVTLLRAPNPPDNIFCEIGTFAANLDNIMKKFYHPVYDSHKTLWMLNCVPELKKFLFAIEDHPVYDSHKTLWMLNCVPELKKFLFAIEDREKRSFLEDIIDEFGNKVLTNVDKLEKGMIHGDINEQNIIVERNGEEWHFKSILDFGDSQYSCYLFELAITMAYAIILKQNMDIGGYVIRGYEKVRKIPEEEFNLLKICIEARICQSLTMGAYTNTLDPNNAYILTAYILTTAKPGWKILRELRSVTNEELLEKWRQLPLEE
ncbi:Phosphotransferase enzyme family [Popillia japonica]|uniref:Hydroxylysine kinase n=1 Tax=Popillia japonica TaxID=7064 RepID=A0AAW1L0W9_POPJA